MKYLQLKKKKHIQRTEDITRASKHHVEMGIKEIEDEVGIEEITEVEADLQAEVTQIEGHKKEKAALKEVANMKHQN